MQHGGGAKCRRARSESRISLVDACSITNSLFGVDGGQFGWKNGRLSLKQVKAGGAHVTPPLGRDFSGIIVDKGAKVTNFNIGDEVYGLSQNFIKGTFAEYATVNANHLARKPGNISMAEAAAVPLVGITAFQAIKSGNVKAGSRVLVIGASGGVGSLAVQIAKAMGAHVIGVCSAKNKALVESLGATQVIDYTKENYIEAVQDIDFVFDTTGNESLSKCQRIMSNNGVFATTLPGPTVAADLISATLGLKSQRVKIVSAMANRKVLESLTQLIESTQIKPVIDSIYSFEAINDGMSKSKTKHAAGKIILAVKGKSASEQSVKLSSGATKPASKLGAPA